MGLFDRLLGRDAGTVSGELALNPAESVESFSAAVGASGLSIEALRAAEAVQQVLAFYRTRRFDRCDPEADGDMLLYQWGVFDWGEGPSFQFDLTRQFMIADALGDEGMSQLSLVLHYALTDALSALPAGNVWCMSPRKADAFERTVLGSAAYAAVAGISPEHVELRWGGV